MNLSQIELLHILQATHFNLSKAAEKMCVVQSAVSRQLQLLEEELGSPLFERHGKKLVALTPLGTQVMKEVSRILLAKQNIKAMAANFLDSSHGTIHIATTHTQAKYFLPVPIQRFRAKYPNVRIYMVQDSPEQLVDLLHAHKADVAICTEKVTADAALIAKKCYEWHHAAIVPQNHPLATEKITRERLADFPILTYSFGYTGRSMIENAFHDKGVSLDVVLGAADTDVIKTYVRLGLGVGLIAGMAYDKTTDADLVMRDLSPFIAPSVTKIAYLKHHYLPLYTQHFIDELLLAGQEFHHE